MSIYEVRVTRRVEAEPEYVDLCVRAKSMKAAREKARKLVKASDRFFGPVSPATITLDVGDPLRLRFTPDCEVL